MSAPAESRLARLGIYRIETPNPFSEIKTNCYFVDGRVPTLIDTALATDEAYGVISRALSRLGHSIRDVKRIILTHGHADHRALAPRIRQESGAEVFCHRFEEGKVVQTSPDQKALGHSRSESFFQAMGVPHEFLESLADGPTGPSIKPRLDCVSHVEDSDEIEFENFALLVLHTPGHSCGSICLHDRENGVLVTGDTLLPDPRITALLEFDILKDNPSYKGLELHLKTLKRLLALGPALALPGHGDIFEEYHAITDAVFERHKKRQRHILRALRNGPRTPYQICRSVFLFISSDDLFLALSEIIGNIDILEEDGKLIKTSDEGVVYCQKPS